MPLRPDEKDEVIEIVRQVVGEILAGAARKPIQAASVEKKEPAPVVKEKEKSAASPTYSEGDSKPEKEETKNIPKRR